MRFPFEIHLGLTLRIGRSDSETEEPHKEGEYSRNELALGETTLYEFSPGFAPNPEESAK